MAQLLTDILSNLVFSNDKNKITTENLNNGDVVFCSDDRTIILKYSDNLYRMGGQEIVDSSTTVKGLVQLNDDIDNTSTTLAATANAVKKAYDKAVESENKANSNYSLYEALLARVEALENIISNGIDGGSSSNEDVDSDGDGEE